MADRVERLTNLLALLLETPSPLSLVEIAAELDGKYPEALTARRGAFERDKAALREIGVPIESEIVRGGPYAGQSRYWIDRRAYELASLDLEPDEQRALQVAVAATRGDSDTAQDALWKLGAGVADQHLAVSAIVPSSPALAALREGVSVSATVSFRYREVDRVVEPYGLLLREGFWYLMGFDRVRGERRTYRVDRIDGPVHQGEPGAFVRPDVDLRSLIPHDPKTLMVGDLDPGDDGPHEARVRITAARSAVIERDLGASRVLARGSDGSIEVTVPCANLDAFRSWVLGLTEHAEVVSPPDARAAVVQWLEQIVGGP